MPSCLLLFYTSITQYNTYTDHCVLPGGQSKCLMFNNISPSSSNYSETVNSLKFGALSCCPPHHSRDRVFTGELCP